MLLSLYLIKKVNISICQNRYLEASRQKELTTAVREGVDTLLMCLYRTLNSIDKMEKLASSANSCVVVCSSLLLCLLFDNNVYMCSFIFLLLMLCTVVFKKTFFVCCVIFFTTWTWTQEKCFANWQLVIPPIILWIVLVLNLLFEGDTFP